MLCRAPSFLSSLPVPHRNAAILQPRNDDNNRPAATSAAPSKAAAAPVALPPALTFAPRSVNNPLAALQQPGCGKMTAPAPTRLPVQLPACCCVFYLPRSAALVSAELLMRLRHECLQLTCCASCRLACAKGECVAWAGLCALAHVGICVHTHTDTHTHTHKNTHSATGLCLQVPPALHHHCHDRPPGKPGARKRKLGPLLAPGSSADIIPSSLLFNSGAFKAPKVRKPGN